MKPRIDTDAKYYVTDKAVVCTLTLKNNRPSSSFIEGRLRDLQAAASWLGVTQNIEPPTVFKGVARLKDGDTNDVELAKEIARKKAMRQLYSVYFNEINKAIDNVYRGIDNYLDLNSRILAKYTELNEEIEELVKE